LATAPEDSAIINSVEASMDFLCHRKSHW
jgi:hypothetical protein